MNDSKEKDPNFETVVTRYEEAIYNGPYEARFEETIHAIDEAQRACATLGLAERGVKDAIAEHWYTRLAAALTVYICDDRTMLDLEALSKICRRKQAVCYIFNASGYRNMSHLIALMGKETEEGTELRLDRAPVLFAFTGVDDMPKGLILLALKQPPQILLTLMLGWLNQRAVFTRRGEENRTLLLESGALIEAAEVSDVDIPQLVNAWMYSTYADTPLKHQIKKSFNNLFTKLLARIEDTIPSPAPPSRERPLMLIIHERFITPHAMYRCYAPKIRGLRKYFDLTALAEEDQIDDGSADLFDQIIKIKKDGKAITEICKTIMGLSPDLIYYPSLGMSHWTVLLAQLRLAPIQLMTHGHPATSMTETIDYVYLNELKGEIEPLHSERILMGPANLNFDPHMDLAGELPELLSPSDREVRVAVNSKVMKLSHRLIDICERLHREANQRVRFSFFPGERNLYFDGLVAAIKCRLPSADVVQYLSYTDFLSEIARCDLALSAFPFGNTNSTVDTSLLGLPTVTHFGTESAGQTDALVLETIGLSDELICRTDEEYFKTALNLIENPAARLAAMNGLNREKIKKRLFSGETEKESEAFSEMVWLAYLRHSELQKGERRTFHYEDWLPAYCD